LVFYNDVLKKLKNTKHNNDLWEHFRSKIRSYIIYNLPYIINLTKFQEIVPNLVEDIITGYIKNIDLNELPK
jgi:hypothetical protein